MCVCMQVCGMNVCMYVCINLCMFNACVHAFLYQQLKCISDKYTII